jgi:hypothetical protein
MAGIATYEENLEDVREMHAALKRQAWERVYLCPSCKAKVIDLKKVTRKKLKTKWKTSVEMIPVDVGSNEFEARLSDIFFGGKRRHHKHVCQRKAQAAFPSLS